MAAEAALHEVKAVMIERESMAREMDELFLSLREQFRNTEKLSMD
jgi:hypothetical protein